MYNSKRDYLKDDVNMYSEFLLAKSNRVRIDNSLQCSNLVVSSHHSVAYDSQSLSLRIHTYTWGSQLLNKHVRP